MREKVGSKLCSFQLSREAIIALKALAEKHQVKLTQVIETLLLSRYFEEFGRIAGEEAQS